MTTLRKLALTTLSLAGLTSLLIPGISGHGILDLSEDPIPRPQYTSSPVAAQAISPIVRDTQRISGTTGGLSESLGEVEFFGSDVTYLGDLDNDGTADIAVGAYGYEGQFNGTGAVYILFLNPDGTVKDYHRIDSTEPALNGALVSRGAFGISVENMGDLNGDGTVDLAVGAPRGGAGKVYFLYLNPDGSVLRYQTLPKNDELTPATGDDFGLSLSNLGDLDGDGHTDLAVGAAGEDSGTVYLLFLNADQTLKSSQKISKTEGGFSADFDSRAGFGSDISLLGDVDGDGIKDIAVGASNQNGVSGAAYILLLNADNTVKDFVEYSTTQGGLSKPPVSNSNFGLGIEGLGDIDGDQIPDVAITEPGAEETAGGVYILYLNADGTLKEEEFISARAYGLDEETPYYFGFRVTATEDIDQDGNQDMVVGVPFNSDSGQYSGAVEVLFLNYQGNVPPVFDSVTADYTLLEETTSDTLETFVATNLDENSSNGGDTLTYTLSGADAAQFTLNNSGELSLALTPDFENPEDEDGDNVYTATVVVSDNGTPAQSATQDITLTVLDNPDEDGDGVLDIDELSTPNNGDANNDGTLDYLQANVATTLSDEFGTNRTVAVTLVMRDCPLERFETVGDGIDATSLILEPLEFEVSCPSTEVELLFHADLTPSEHRIVKINGPETSVLTEAQLGTVVINSQPVLKATYSVSDGGELDTGLAGDERIIDPVGLRRITSTAESDLPPQLIRTGGRD